MSSMSYIRALLATACPSRRSAFARDCSHDALRIRIFNGESFWACVLLEPSPSAQRLRSKFVIESKIAR
jgi:hypothetical protein